MNRATVDRLNRINLEFYSDRAAEFDRARDRPWQGWERIAEEVRPAAGERRLTVLDFACGNGRFASFLNKELGGFDYVGVDSSPELLELARTRIAELPGVSGELLESDVTREAASAGLGGRRFDLIAVIGLLHHVPSLRLRGRLLADLVALLAPGGLLAVAFWQFAAFERFRDRFVDWDAFNRDAADPVDTRQLETGDHLLAWGGDRRAVRYCHWSDPAEIERLISATAAASHEIYSGRAGDRFNLYALIRAGLRSG